MPSKGTSAGCPPKKEPSLNDENSISSTPSPLMAALPPSALPNSDKGARPAITSSRSTKMNTGSTSASTPLWPQQLRRQLTSFVGRNLVDRARVTKTIGVTSSVTWALKWRNNYNKIFSFCSLRDVFRRRQQSWRRFTRAVRTSSSGGQLQHEDSDYENPDSEYTRARVKNGLLACLFSAAVTMPAMVLVVLPILACICMAPAMHFKAVVPAFVSSSSNRFVGDLGPTPVVPTPIRKRAVDEALLVPPVEEPRIRQGAVDGAPSDGASTVFVPRIGSGEIEDRQHTFTYQEDEDENYYYFSGQRVWSGVIVAGCCFFLWYSHKLFVHSVNMAGNPARLEDPSLIWFVRHFFGPARSRIARYLSEIELPQPWRAPVYSVFGKLYDVKLDECRYPLETYTCFQEFFCRAVADGVHVIDKNCAITSPVDGRMVACGEIMGSEARVPQVKGASYDVTAFLGTDPYRSILERKLAMARSGSCDEIEQELYGGVRLHKLAVQETRENVDEMLLDEEKQFKRQRVIRQKPPMYNFSKSDIDRDNIQFQRLNDPEGADLLNPDLNNQAGGEGVASSMPGTNVPVSMREKSWAGDGKIAGMKQVIKENAAASSSSGDTPSVKTNSTPREILSTTAATSGSDSGDSTRSDPSSDTEDFAELGSDTLNSPDLRRTRSSHGRTLFGSGQEAVPSSGRSRSASVNSSSSSSPSSGTTRSGGSVDSAAARTPSASSSSANFTDHLKANLAREQRERELFEEHERKRLEFEDSLRKRAEDLDCGLKLAYAVLYLAPGDYHRFHSPAENFRIDVGRHYPGELFPVNPLFADWIPDLFTCNERLVLSGCYTDPRTAAEPGEKRKNNNVKAAEVEGGVGASNLLSMHMTAVAAYNVGGIWLDFDEHLRTNDGVGAPFEISNMVTSKEFSSRWGSWEKILTMKKGDLVGGFKMGSTVVLIFECPKEFEWKIEEGQTIRMGEPLMG